MTQHVHVSQTSTGDFILAVSLPDRIRLYNIAKLHPRVISPDPPEHDIVSDLATRLRLDEDGEEEDQSITKTCGKSPEPQNWEVLVPGAQEGVQACVLGFGGRLLVTVGKRRIWIWREATKVNPC
jgi:polycomb protein EED